jgi:hypothetical protein
MTCNLSNTHVRCLDSRSKLRLPSFAEMTWAHLWVFTVKDLWGNAVIKSPGEQYQQ